MLVPVFLVYCSLRLRHAQHYGNVSVSLKNKPLHGELNMMENKTYTIVPENIPAIDRYMIISQMV